MTATPDLTVSSEGTQDRDKWAACCQTLSTAVTPNCAPKGIQDGEEAAIQSSVLSAT